MSVALNVEEGQFFIGQPDSSDQSWGTDDASLVKLTADGMTLLLLTGCQDGPVNVTTQVGRPQPFSDAPPEGWEYVEEVSVSVTGPLFLATFQGREEPFLTPQEPGTHRVRVSCKGRGIDYGGYPEEPVEDFLIEVWPEPGPRARAAAGQDAATPAARHTSRTDRTEC